MQVIHLPHNHRDPVFILSVRDNTVPLVQLRTENRLERLVVKALHQRPPPAPSLRRRHIFRPVILLRPPPFHVAPGCASRCLLHASATPVSDSPPSHLHTFQPFHFQTFPPQLATPPFISSESQSRASPSCARRNSPSCPCGRRDDRSRTDSSRPDADCGSSIHLRRPTLPRPPEH